MTHPESVDPSVDGASGEAAESNDSPAPPLNVIHRQPEVDPATTDDEGSGQVAESRYPRVKALPRSIAASASNRRSRASSCAGVGPAFLRAVLPLLESNLWPLWPFTNRSPGFTGSPQPHSHVVGVIAPVWPPARRFQSGRNPHKTAKLSGRRRGSLRCLPALRWSTPPVGSGRRDAAGWMHGCRFGRVTRARPVTSPRADHGAS